MMQVFIDTPKSQTAKDRRLYSIRRGLYLSASDLMSGIVYCTGLAFPTLATPSNLLSLINLTIEVSYDVRLTSLTSPLQSEDSEVRSLTFMMIAEISSRCPAFLEVASVKQYAEVLLKNIVLFPSNLDPGDTYLNMCNNSIATLNQFCKNYPNVMSGCAGNLAQKLVEIFDNSKQVTCNEASDALLTDIPPPLQLNKDLARNMCFTLGSAALLDLD